MKMDTARTDQIWIPSVGVLDPPEGYEYAIVARVAYAQPPSGKSRFYFICAGRTATGTAVAGKYLASRWSEMLKMYEDRDPATDSLLIVLSHRYADPSHGEDDNCEVSVRESKQFRRWWPEETGKPKPRPLLSIDDSRDTRAE